jgi:hypothetical protein
MSSMHDASFPRRTLLRGLGATLSLPFLESLAPRGARAAAAKAPLRMAFVYLPNGAIMPKWNPTGEGKDYQLSPTLAPLSSHKEDIQVITGLAHDKARANGDGAGDHARANATFLTGCQARKTSGADIKLGVSVDQIAAQKIGHLSRLPSLELSCDRAAKSGGCDSGYSCAYQFNVSWKTESMPMAPENNPRAVFERLFGDALNAAQADENAKRRQAMRKSLLDFVQEDAKSLQGRLGNNDRRKLDEYLMSVRDLEMRIERAEKFVAELPDVQRPTGIPSSYREHIRTMFDLLTLAFQTDTTRVATFMLAHDGSNRPIREAGVNDGHHDLSHHQNDPGKIAKIEKIDLFYMEQFAYFLERLKSQREGEANLLHNSMILLGSGISDANRHSHHDLPAILAGRGAGTLSAGRHLVVPKHTPMTNLFLSMLDRMGVPADRVGDSTGRLDII